MNKKIEILDSLITTHPITLQIAKDNKWEECLKIQAPLAKGILSDYLSSSAFDLLSIEFEFNELDGAFVFNISFNTEMIIKDPLDFLIKSQQLFFTYTDFSSLINSIDKEIIGKEYLFSFELDIARLSIFNHWMSSNPVDIYVKGNAKRMNDLILKEKLNGHDNLLECELNYQAIALIYCYDNGIRHIIKVPSAIKVDNKWRLDAGKI